MRLKALTLAVAGFLVAACATEVEVPSYADITFAASPKIPMLVADVSSKVNYAPPLTAPHVGHEFPVDPATTAARWAADRIDPVGPTGSAVLTVLEASAIETQLAETTGLKGIVTVDQAQLYAMKLVVLLEAENPNTLSTAQTTVTVTRSGSVDEDATINEREKIWYDMTEKLMADLNTELEAAIEQHMSLFLTP